MRLFPFDRDRLTDGRSREALGARAFWSADTLLSDELLLDMVVPSLVVEVNETVGFLDLLPAAFDTNFFLLEYAVITPGVGSLSLAAEAPITIVEIFLAPAAGALTAAGQDPTDPQATIIIPDVAALALAGATPALLFEVFLAPSAGSLLILGRDPVLVLDLLITPQSAALVLIGYTPLLLRSFGGVVRDEDTGVPVAGAEVHLFRSDDHVFVASTISGIDGGYIFEVVDQAEHFFAVAFKGDPPDPTLSGATRHRVTVLD